MNNSIYLYTDIYIKGSNLDTHTYFILYRDAFLVKYTLQVEPLLWQVHTNLNLVKVFTSSSYKPPTCITNGTSWHLIFTSWNFTRQGILQLPKSALSLLKICVYWIDPRPVDCAFVPFNSWELTKVYLWGQWESVLRLLATLPCSARTSLSWLAAVWHVSLQQEWSCWFGTQFLGTLRVVLLKYNMYNYKFLGSCQWRHMIMVKQPTDPLNIFLRASFLE